MNNTRISFSTLDRTSQSKNARFLLLFISSVFLFACSEKVEVKPKLESPIKAQHELIVEDPVKPKYADNHEYGGWSCPDNLRGFPAVDLHNLDEVPVVNGRMATQEETRDGTSLLYLDPVEYPDAKPLDMTMPKLARYYSEYTKKNEVVIVIQALIADKDTIVGFRYLNGGNGSAWFGEVEFMSDDEIDKIGPTPFVSFNTEFNASAEKIWDVITNPAYAKTLGKMFDGGGGYVESDWNPHAEVYYRDGSDNVLKTGLITALWDNMYIQIDYNFNGFHYVEKFLILDNKETNTTQFHIVSGPYNDEFTAKETAWYNWLQKVKDLSEIETDFIDLSTTN